MGSMLNYLAPESKIRWLICYYGNKNLILNVQLNKVNFNAVGKKFFGKSSVFSDCSYLKLMFSNVIQKFSYDY